MNNVGIKTYQEALLERGHNFGLKVRNGWIFARVKDYEPIVNVNYDRFDGMTTASASSSIAGGTAATWHLLEDANSEDYLAETEKNRVLQVFMGMWPMRLRKWMQFPETLQRGNLDKILVPAVPTATTGGYIDGLMSPYMNPTDQGMMIVPEEVNVYHGLFNPELYTVQPKISLFIRRMDVQWLNPLEAKAKAKIAEIIQRVETGKNGVAAMLWSPGLKAWDYSSMDKLHIQPVRELSQEALQEMVA